MAKKIARKGHMKRAGVGEHYRWVMHNDALVMVTPVKLSGSKGMKGQIFMSAATDKEPAVYRLVRDKEGKPLPYHQIGVSARERVKIEAAN